MHVKLILHEFGTCKIDFTYIRYYLAAKIDFTGFPILAAPDLGFEVMMHHKEKLNELVRIISKEFVLSPGCVHRTSNKAINR